MRLPSLKFPLLIFSAKKEKFCISILNRNKSLRNPQFLFQTATSAREINFYFNFKTYKSSVILVTIPLTSSLPQILTPISVGLRVRIFSANPRREMIIWVRGRWTKATSLSIYRQKILLINKIFHGKNNTAIFKLTHHQNINFANQFWAPFKTKFYTRTIIGAYTGIIHPHVHNFLKQLILIVLVY